MTERPTSQETRTDYVGEYRAYIFADGHVETDPPGRPMSKEDMQRKRVLEYARANAGNFANKVTTLKNPAGTPAPAVVDCTVTTNRSLLLFNFEETQQALSQAAATARTPDANIKTLVTTFGVGGPISG